MASRPKQLTNVKLSSNKTPNVLLGRFSHGLGVIAVVGTFMIIGLFLGPPPPPLLLPYLYMILPLLVSYELYLFRFLFLASHYHIWDFILVLAGVLFDMPAGGHSNLKMFAVANCSVTLRLAICHGCDCFLWPHVVQWWHYFFFHLVFLFYPQPPINNLHWQLGNNSLIFCCFIVNSFILYFLVEMWWFGYFYVSFFVFFFCRRELFRCTIEK